MMLEDLTNEFNPYFLTQLVRDIGGCEDCSWLLASSMERYSVKGSRRFENENNHFNRIVSILKANKFCFMYLEIDGKIIDMMRGGTTLYGNIALDLKYLDRYILEFIKVDTFSSPVKYVSDKTFDIRFELSNLVKQNYNEAIDYLNKICITDKLCLLSYYTYRSLYNHCSSITYFYEKEI